MSIRASVVLIGGRSRLRFFFLCAGGLPGHIAGIVMELSRLLFARLFLIWALVVAQAILL
jgi:hypothetical protein